MPPPRPKIEHGRREGSSVQSAPHGGDQSSLHPDNVIVGMQPRLRNRGLFLKKSRGGPSVGRLQMQMSAVAQRSRRDVHSRPTRSTTRGRHVRPGNRRRRVHETATLIWPSSGRRFLSAPPEVAVLPTADGPKVRAGECGTSVPTVGGRLLRLESGIGATCSSQLWMPVRCIRPRQTGV